MKLVMIHKADAAFIRLSNDKPSGDIEINEGVVIHVTDLDKIVAIEFSM